MAKSVFNRLNVMFPVALVLFGWLLFTIGVTVPGPVWLKLVLLSAARVLP